MKKINKLIILSIMFSMLFIIKVSAHNVELSDDISLPNFIINGSGTVSLQDGDELYYQVVSVSDDVKNQIISKDNEANDFFENTYQPKRKELEAEVLELKDDYEAKAAIDPSSDETNAARELLLAKTEEAKTYNTNAQKTIEQYYNDIELVKPTYDDSKWIKSTDRKINIDTNTFSGEKGFVVWIRVIRGGTTLYNNQFYTVLGQQTSTPSTDTTPTNTTPTNTTPTNTTPQTNENENNQVNTNTEEVKTTVKNPHTNINSISLIVFGGIVIIGIILFRKNKFSNI